ncbi:MAG TPA: ATP-binding protein, partial [Paludibacter sp.]
FAEKIPVVLISGMQDVELSLSLIKEGAQDYITKQDLNSILLGKTIQFAIERKKLLSELIIANKELAFQNEEKEKRAAELVIANKELVFQNQEKEKRADELIVANQTILQSEENFRHSISESSLGIRIISIERETIYVNKAFLDIYEYNSLEEFKSTPAINRYTPESYAQHQERKEKRKNGHDIFDYELSIVRKNAEVRYVKVWRKEVLWNGVKHYQAFNLDITEQKQSEVALNNSQQELRKFATHIQNVREEEKLSLAREIHDDLGQILVALKMDLGMFKKKISRGNENINSEEILSKFDDFSNLVDNTIKSARRIMNGLRPELIELLGFEEACKSFLRDFDETHHIKSRFESAIMNLNISLEQSVALFRILQEALTNVAKHAKATLVTVQLSNPAGKLVMVIVDNGVGFDENNKGRQDSYGMIGMKERVFLLEGELNITSKVGKGTSVRVEMPYIS